MKRSMEKYVRLTERDEDGCFFSSAVISSKQLINDTATLENGLHHIKTVSSLTLNLKKGCERVKLKFFGQGI